VTFVGLGSRAAEHRLNEPHQFVLSIPELPYGEQFCTVWQAEMNEDRNDSIDQPIKSGEVDVSKRLAWGAFMSMYTVAFAILMIA